MTFTIACGLDETGDSEQVAAVASRLAADLGAGALLVHVRGGSMLSLRTRGIRKSLQALAREHGFPEDAEIQVKRGHPASTLAALAERAAADLLVVGAGGRSSVSTGLLGSVTATLLRDAPCPVVAVPAGAPAPVDANGRAVVGGVAGHEADRLVLRLADNLANRLGGQLLAVCAYDQAVVHAAVPNPPLEGELREDAEACLDRVLGESNSQALGIAVPLPPAQALERVAREHGASLIVVGAGSRTSLTLGSVPTQLAAQGQTPLAVLTHRGRHQ